MCLRQDGCKHTTPEGFRVGVQEMCPFGSGIITVCFVLIVSADSHFYFVTKQDGMKSNIFSIKLSMDRKAKTVDDWFSFSEKVSFLKAFFKSNCVNLQLALLTESPEMLKLFLEAFLNDAGLSLWSTASVIRKDLCWLTDGSLVSGGVFSSYYLADEGIRV